MEYEGLSNRVDFLRLQDPGERFELVNVIGEGTYGEVFAAKDSQTR